MADNRRRVSRKLYASNANKLIRGNAGSIWHMLHTVISQGDAARLDEILTEAESKGANALKNLNYAAPSFSSIMFNDKNNLLMISIMETSRNGVAALQGYRDTIATLLRHDVDVNYQNKRGDTVLHMILNGDGPDETSRDVVDNIVMEVLQMVLEAGADPSLQNNSGRTALSELLFRTTAATPAHKQKVEDIVNLLLQRGWNPMLDEGVYHPLVIAERKGLTRVADMLRAYQEQYKMNNPSPNMNMSNASQGGRRKTRRGRKGRKGGRAKKTRRN